MFKKRKLKRILVVTMSTILVVLVIGLAAMPFLLLNPMLNKRYDLEEYSPTTYNVKAEEITLETSDSLKLASWKVDSIGESKGTIIIFSGIQNPSVTAFFGYAKMFSEQGWDSLLIEMRARGRSEGKEIGLGLTEWKDVIAGVEYLKGEEASKNLPIVVCGTSMGASTVITATGQDQRIDGVISILHFPLGKMQ